MLPPRIILKKGSFPFVKIKYLLLVLKEMAAQVVMNVRKRAEEINIILTALGDFQLFTYTFPDTIKPKPKWLFNVL
jgi:hypothetical protein